MTPNIFIPFLQPRKSYTHISVWSNTLCSYVWFFFVTLMRIIFFQWHQLC